MEFGLVELSKVFASGNTIGPLLVGFVAQDSICWVNQVRVLCLNGRLHGPRVQRNDLVALGQQLPVSRRFLYVCGSSPLHGDCGEKSCHIFKPGAGRFPLQPLQRERGPTPSL